MNSTNTVDIEYSFSRDHSIQVFRPWVDDLYTTKQEGGKVEHRNDFEVSTYLPPLRLSPAISASHSVLFAASSDNYVYAYDIQDKDNPNGTILRFPYEMCDIGDRLAFDNTMASTNFSMVPCGCPAYAHLPAKPILAAPVLVEDSTKAIFACSNFRRCVIINIISRRCSRHDFKQKSIQIRPIDMPCAKCIYTTC